MTFLADEGVGRQIVERLRLDGYEVAYVAEMSPGIKAVVVSRAVQEHGQELAGAFAVLSPGNIRIRREILR